MNEELFDNLVMYVFSEYELDSERMKFIDIVTRLLQDDPSLIDDHNWEWLARAGGFRRENEKEIQPKFDWQI